MYNIEARSNEAACRCPLLSVRDHDAVTPEVLGKMIAKRLYSKVLEMDRLIILHNFRIDGMIGGSAKRMAFSCFALESFEERCPTIQVFSPSSSL